MNEPLAHARDALLSWYDEGSRELPWRGTSDPYAIWVSELMCQQTRVDTVIPYFQRWMAALPTIEALARASIDDVLLLWQGLGYYRRARHLHAGAQRVMEDFGGEIPRQVEQLRSLPGIGDYTAGAIASIAFQEPAPALDGNVLRVFSRVLRSAAPIDTSAGVRPIRSFAEAFVQGPRPGDVNQALMELGATLCTPHAAPCKQCPLSTICEAATHGDALAYPVKKNKTAVREETVHAWVISRADGALWVTKRRADQLLGGLWEFPLLAEPPHGPEWTYVGEEKHVFSHIHMRIQIWHHALEDEDPEPGEDVQALPTHARYDEGRWADHRALRSLAQSTLMRKIRAASDKKGQLPLL